MKKITSVLLTVVMLASMLCTTASAVDASAYVEAQTNVNLSSGILTVEFIAAAATTNGKITVEYDPNVLTYSACSVNGTAPAVSQTAGSVTFGYATSTPDAIQGGGSVATLTLRIASSAQGTTYLRVTVEEFNEGLGLGTDPLSVPVVISTPAPVTPIPTLPSRPGTGSTTTEPDKDEGEDTGSDGETEGEGGTQPGTGETEPAVTIDPAEVFTDVSEEQWFYPAVTYVVNQGYFRGTSDNKFEPNSPMTRAMFVTVLGRIEGIDENANVSTIFTDVPIGTWYTAAVAWASGAEIVAGISADLFDPNGNITREQMAVLLYRYAQYLGLDLSYDASLLGQFGDSAEVSGWASEAMAWAVSHGLISGTNNGLEPQAQATRAQVAQIILNFSNLLG